jgi:hypothetical protein
MLGEARVGRFRDYLASRHERVGWKTVFRLRVAAVLISGGLLIEIATLRWAHPLAFIAYVALGGTLMLAGVLIYMWTALTHPEG